MRMVCALVSSGRANGTSTGVVRTDLRVSSGVTMFCCFPDLCFYLDFTARCDFGGSFEPGFKLTDPNELLLLGTGVD